jgi:hypothetical protein
MNRQLCKTLRTDIENALKSVESKHGVQFKIGSMRFDDVEVNFKVNTVHAGDNGEKSKFEKDARFTPFANMYGREFTHSFDTWKIVGYSSRSTKYPIIAESASLNKKMKFTPDILRLLIEK